MGGVRALTIIPARGSLRCGKTAQWEDLRGKGQSKRQTMVPSPLASTLSSLPTAFPVANPARSHQHPHSVDLGAGSVTDEDRKGSRWEPQRVDLAMQVSPSCPPQNLMPINLNGTWQMSN